MFESGQFSSEYYASQRDALTGIVLAIIIISLLYAGVAIVYDVTVTLKPGACQRKARLKKEINVRETEAAQKSMLTIVTNPLLGRGKRIKGSELPDSVPDEGLWSRIKQQYTQLEKHLEELRKLEDSVETDEPTTVARTIVKKRRKEFGQMVTSDAPPLPNTLRGRSDIVG